MEEKGMLPLNEEYLMSKIYIVRGVQVMLDFDLAAIYGYTTKRFNEQVKNNIERFDDDFRFQLTELEFKNLMSKISTSSSAGPKGDNLRSKISTSSWGGTRYLPYAFTELGIYSDIPLRWFVERWRQKGVFHQPGGGHSALPKHSRQLGGKSGVAVMNAGSWYTANVLHFFRSSPAANKGMVTQIWAVEEAEVPPAPVVGGGMV